MITRTHDMLADLQNYCVFNQSLLIPLSDIPEVLRLHTDAVMFLFKALEHQRDMNTGLLHRLAELNVEVRDLSKELNEIHGAGEMDL